MWARRCSGCSPLCSRTRRATPASSCCSAPRSSGRAVSSALWYALIAAGGNLLGAAAVIRHAARGLKVIEHFVAFGAGFMLAVAIVELLPAALSRSGAIAPALVLAGYLAVHLTQHTVTPHFHFGEETHPVSSVAGTSALVGLLLHTFFDGVAIASAFLVRPELGIMVFVAILLHKLPEGVTISSLMLAGGRSGGRAVGAAALLGIATLLGVVLTEELGFLVQQGLGASVGILCRRCHFLPNQDVDGWRVVTEPTLFQGSTEPLAARMRPKTLDQFLGQEHLLGPGTALGDLIRRGDVGSCIFWGPPGSGETTLAKIIANYTDRHFEPFSAVTEGVARVREIIKE